MIQVANLLIENEISHILVATDENNDTMNIEVEYGIGERDIIHEIEDAIDDNTAESTDDDDEVVEDQNDDNKR